MGRFLYDRDLRHERVKPTCFLLIRETEGNDKNVLSRLWPYQINIEILKTLSTLKLIPELYLDPSRTSTVKVYYDFRKEAPP